MTRGACRTVALAAWIVLISTPALGQDAGALDPQAREAIRKAIDISHQPRRTDLSAEDRAVIAEAIRTKRAVQDAAPSWEATPFRPQGGPSAATSKAPPSLSPHEGTLQAQAQQLRVVLENTSATAHTSGEIGRLRERLADYAREIEAINALGDPSIRHQRMHDLLSRVDADEEKGGGGTPVLRIINPSSWQDSPEIPDSVVRYGR